MPWVRNWDGAPAMGQGGGTRLRTGAAMVELQSLKRRCGEADDGTMSPFIATEKVDVGRRRVASARLHRIKART